MVAGKALLIGMPGWSVRFPFHALGYVGGIIRDAGWSCTVADVNIMIYRIVAAPYRKHWDASSCNAWFDSEFANEVYERYRTEIEAILAELDRKEPYDIIAFTANALTRHLTLKASKYLRSLNEGPVILFGGADCLPTYYNTRFFSQQGAPDLICQGEAEIALPRFLAVFKATGDYRTSIPGFVFKDGDTIVDTGEPELPRLDGKAVRPEWAQFNLELYESPGDFPIFFSRGCPNRCAFCVTSPYLKQYRTRPASDVVDEIRTTLVYSKHYTQSPTFHFSDLLINGSVAQLRRLCDEIAESDLDIEWEAYARFRPEMTRKVLNAMRSSGCTAILWGLESASQIVIDLMDKNYRIEDAKRILIDAHKAGINNYVPIIVGFPGETVDDLITTISFIFQFKPYAQFMDPFLLQIYNSSPLGTCPDRWGVSAVSQDEWISNDLRNDRDVRLFRQFVIRNVIGNGSLAAHSLVGWEDICEVDFNKLPVASEIAGLLLGLWSVCKMEAKMSVFLTGKIPDEDSNLEISDADLLYWHPRNVCREISLRNWFNRDKNLPGARTAIGNYLLEALRSVRKSVSK